MVTAWPAGGCRFMAHRAGAGRRGALQAATHQSRCGIRQKKTRETLCAPADTTRTDCRGQYQPSRFCLPPTRHMKTPLWSGAS